VVKKAPINYIFTPAVEIKVEQQLSCSTNFCAFLCAECFCDVNSKRLIKVWQRLAPLKAPAAAGVCNRQRRAVATVA
jgi:hypothetical protein